MKLRLSLFEIFLLETVVMLVVWLLNDYIAVLLTLILAAVVSAVLIIALLAEFIERSKVPAKYFYVMGITVLALLGAGLVYVVISGGNLDFLKAW